MSESKVNDAIADIRTSQIVAGKDVSSAKWSEIANAFNALISGGVVMVPDDQNTTGPGTGLTEVRRVYWFPHRPQAVQRFWRIRANIKTGTNSFTIGGASYSISHTSATTYEKHEFEIIEDLTEQQNVGGEVIVAADGTAQSPAIWGVYCVDIPRPNISDVTPENGAYTHAFESGQPVTYESSRNIIEALDGSRVDIGYKTYLNWAGSYSDTDEAAIDTTSTSFGKRFTDGVPILARKLYRTDTTTQILVKVRARVSAGTGEIRVTTSGGGSTTLSVTSTTYAWYDFVFDVDCTDVDSTDGRQTAASPAWFTLQVEYRHTTGFPDTMVLSSVFVGDKPFDPLSLSPTLWLRADLGVTTSSELVTDWADQSGNGNDFTQATAANRPGLVTAMNGEKAVRFNGSSGYIASAASLALPTNYVTWAVLKARDTGAGARIYTAPGATEALSTINGGQARFKCGSITVDSAASVVDSPTTLMIDASAYPDGTPYVKNVAGTAFTGGTDSSPISGTFYIGSDLAGATLGDFELYEFAIFDSANVDATARAQLEAYARKRYYTEDFTPLDLRPEIWVRGDKGASVSAWLDQSGNGRNFSQATGSAQPALETGTCGQVGFRFASGDYFTSDASYTLPTTHLIWAVYEIDSGATSASGYVWQGPDSSNNSALHYGTGGHIYMSAAVGGTGTLVSATDVSGQGPVVIGVSDEGSTETLYLNNVLERSASNATSGGAGTIYLGNATTTTVPLQGILYEYAVFDRSKITAADINALYAYAAQRYSINDDFNMLTDTSGYPLLDTDSTILRDAN